MSRTRNRSSRTVAYLLAAAGAVTAVAAVAAALPAAATPPALVWTACAGPDDPPGMECATVDVPVDWSDPDGRTLPLPLARLPVANPVDRIGAVVAIPGGPGGSGIADLRRSAPHFAGLRERFDVVGFDPRNAVGALPPACREPGPVQIAPATRAEYDAQARANRAAFERCRAGDPELVDHLDSASVARDVEAVRVAMGEPRLSLIGSSYGGLPAVAYARLHPERVRAMFLDGVVPHAGPAELDRITYAALQASFDRFADWCAAEPACAWHGRDVRTLWRELVAAADREPIPVPGAGPEAAYSGFDLLLPASALVNGASWERFAAAAERARTGDAGGFAELLPLPKQPMFPLGAVHCQDGLGYEGYEDYRRAQRRAEELSPDFAGVAHVLRLPCSGWTGPVPNPPAALPAGELPPLLGAGSWSDALPTAAAVDRVPGSVTVRLDGPGHVLYQSGVRCVIEHADRYLIDLRLPPPGSLCRGER